MHTFVPHAMDKRDEHYFSVAPVRSYVWVEYRSKWKLYNALKGREKRERRIYLVAKFSGARDMAVDLCAGTMAVTKACPLLSEHICLVGIKRMKVVSKFPFHALLRSPGDKYLALRTF